MEKTDECQEMADSSVDVYVSTRWWDDLAHNYRSKQKWKGVTEQHLPNTDNSIVRPAGERR